VGQGNSEAGWRLESTYAALPEELFKRIEPAKVPAPHTIILNRPLAESLGLNPDVLDTAQGARWFSGNELPPGSHPIAQAYAGHQYAHQTMLGDGRAILCGEQITPQNQRIDIQLKGSGRTPYSRNGDGKAALGPMLREYIISEAMHALGIPTTRSLAVVGTGETVWRQTESPGGILTRTAASHIRVGTFEYASAVPDPAILPALANYVLHRHYPELVGEKHPHRAMFAAILERQAQLIVQWMGVGFVHGVMNTDNMAVSGETIDYGPCAFLDVFHPETVFSSIDRHGRYAYGQQPHIAHWNLTRLAESMLPLFSNEEKEAVDVANEILSVFPGRFQELWLGHFAKKLGLFQNQEGDQKLIEDFLVWMRENKADFTNTFRNLDPEKLPQDSSAEFRDWHLRWIHRLTKQNQSLERAVQLMHSVNPAFIPRNHKVEEALVAAEAEHDLAPLHGLLEVLANPFSDQHERGDFASPAPANPVPYVTYCGT